MYPPGSSSAPSWHLGLARCQQRISPTLSKSLFFPMNFPVCGRTPQLEVSVFKSAASTFSPLPLGRAVTSTWSKPQQAADRLRRAQDRNGDRTCPLGAAAQHTIDIAGICHQPSHLPADMAEHLDRQLGQ